MREWLAGVTTGRVVEYDPATASYRLPPEHAAFLTRAAGPDNLAIQTQYVVMLANVEAPIIECFRNGGGVSYSEFGDFHRLMAEESGAVHGLGTFWGEQTARQMLSDAGFGSVEVTNVEADHFNNYFIARKS